MRRRLYRWAARAKRTAPPGLVRRALQVRSLVGDGPLVGLPPARRVVAIAPHPDDETLCFGGTLARLADAGAEIVLVVATDGDATVGATASPQETAGRRRDEASRAAAVLGVERLVFAGLPDGALDAHTEQLAEVLADHLPGADLVLTTWFGDGHPDHEAVAVALAAAAPGPEVEIWGGEVWTPVTPNRIVPITEVVDRKRRAAAIHETATGAFDVTAVLGLSRYRSVHGLAGQGHAEAFLAADAPAWLELARASRTGDGP